MSKRVRYRGNETRQGVTRTQREITDRRMAFRDWPNSPVGRDPDPLGARASELVSGLSVSNLQIIMPELYELTLRDVAQWAKFDRSVLDLITRHIDYGLKSARDHRTGSAQTHHERIDELLWLGGYDDITYCPPGYWALPMFGVPKLMNLCGRLGLMHVFNDVARTEDELTELLKLASGKPCSANCNECIFDG